ncbi:MAG: DUF3883 domain-containing protein [Parvularcula sp.]|nr:DUF3883 domain-containing protein [Parvularcula sp.]
MAKQEDPSGTDWTQEEIDLVVSDYFDMRDKFLRGEAFVKARHYERVIQLTGRSKGSVERKYMNISATLERLSLPWLQGYAPYRNFQGALLKSVEQFVATEWDTEIVPNTTSNEFAEDEQVYVGPQPDIAQPLVTENQEMERIARKFDPALRDERNRKTGLAGEKRVYESEIARLHGAGRPDLANRVQWVSHELGDGAGYDILSFNTKGKERFLEVKTTVGHNRTPFFLSKNEHDFAKESAQNFRVFRLYNWGRSPQAFLIKPPLESSLILEPSAFRASFG